MDIARYAYAARFCETLHTRSNIYTVTIKITAFDDYVTETNTNAKQNLLIFGDLGISCRDCFLDVRRTFDRLDRTVEFNKCAITRRFEYPSAILFCLGVKLLTPEHL